MVCLDLDSSASVELRFEPNLNKSRPTTAGVVTHVTAWSRCILRARPEASRSRSQAPHYPLSGSEHSREVDTFENLAPHACDGRGSSVGL